MLALSGIQRATHTALDMFALGYGLALRKRPRMTAPKRFKAHEVQSADAGHRHVQRQHYRPMKLPTEHY